MLVKDKKEEPSKNTIDVSFNEEEILENSKILLHVNLKEKINMR